MAKAIDECIGRLEDVVDKLHAEGTESILIVTALIEVTVKAARLDSTLAPAHLDAASDALALAAHHLRWPPESARKP